MRSYPWSMARATARGDMVRSTSWRPRSPLASIDELDSDKHALSADASSSTELSTHQPAPVLASDAQGVPFDAMTGVPTESASATIIPKFSL